MNEYPQIELSEWTKVDAMPDTQNCLHGDFQPGNIIMAGGQHYWIDLGWLSQGWYMMDLAHLYKMMIEDSMIPQVQDHVEALNRELRPYAALDMVRTSYLHPMTDQRFIEFFKMRITHDLS